MKSCKKELWFETSPRREMVKITRKVENCVAESGINEGPRLVNTKQI